MGTSSLIGIYDAAERDLEIVYVHHDGDPPFVGRMLLEHYRDTERLRRLMEKGGFSSLKPEIERIDYYTEATKWNPTADEDEPKEVSWERASLDSLDEVREHLGRNYLSNYVYVWLPERGEFVFYEGIGSFVRLSEEIVGSRL